MVQYLSQIWIVAIVGLFSFTTLAVGDETSAGASGKPSGYKLHVGQELNFEGTSEFKYERGALHGKDSWKLLVVKQNDDGGWRMLVCHATAHGQTFQGNEQVHYQPERVSMAWCDIAPNGTLAENPTLGFMLDVTSILPQLPDHADSGKWEADNAATATRHMYALAVDGEEPGHLQFVDETASPFNVIYASTSKSKFWFDEDRGLVDRIESETTQGFGFNGKGAGVTTLKNVEERDPATCAQIGEEMTRYFNAKQEYGDLLDRAAKQPDQTAALIAAAKTKLEDARKETKTEIIREQLDKDLEQHANMARYTEEQAKLFANVLGQPTPTWETTDLDGSTRSIDACRGKVVVLDFWYRGCGWCIRAMPQMKQVATHYKDRPVAVFGMNTDEKEDDARFVVEKLALNYPNLKAQGLPEKYGVRGFPTLVIIDQTGVVRDLHVGYSPNLAKNVISSIDKLLAGGPVNAPSEK